MALLKSAYPGEQDDAYDAARERIGNFLRTAARLEIINAPATVSAGTKARVTVRVTNLSGHKLPTGIDTRLMWLQISAGSAVISGAYAMDELVEDPQLRTYRFVPGHLEAGHTVSDDHDAHHTVVVEDTRIPPAGMVSSSRTAPVGRDYSGGGPGGALRHTDEVTFEIPTAMPAGSLVVRARLLYQAVTKHYVEVVTNANHTNNNGSRLLSAWNATGRSAPFEIAKTEATIQVTQNTGSDAGTSDAGTVDASAVDATGVVDVTSAVDATVDVVSSGDSTSSEASIGDASRHNPTSAGCGCMVELADERSQLARLAVGIVLAIVGLTRRRSQKPWINPL